MAEKFTLLYTNKMEKDKLTRLKDALNLLRLEGVIKTQTDFAALLVLAYLGLKGSHLVWVNKKGGAIAPAPSAVSSRQI